MARVLHLLELLVLLVLQLLELLLPLVLQLLELFLLLVLQLLELLLPLVLQLLLLVPMLALLAVAAVVQKSNRHLEMAQALLLDCVYRSHSSGGPFGNTAVRSTACFH